MAAEIHDTLHDGSGILPQPDDPLWACLSALSGRTVDFFPKPGNAGDAFITYSTFELFKFFNIKCRSHSSNDVVESDIVFIGGGGNLVEDRYREVADIILRHRHVGRLILLPQTVVGYADVLAQTYDNLEVYCRERQSYAAVLANGANPANTFLSQDMVFFLRDTHFTEFSGQGEGAVEVERTDGEALSPSAQKTGNIDISLSWNGDLWRSPSLCKYVTFSLAAYLAQYEEVTTDRLHVAILSAFLGKKVTMRSNSYFKNRAIWEHSIQPRFEHVRFVEPDHLEIVEPDSTSGASDIESQIFPRPVRSLDSLVASLPDWRRRRSERTNFWNHWLETRGASWPEDYAARFDRSRALDANLVKMVDQHVGRSILDVECGPVPSIGYCHPNEDIQVVATDSLAIGHRATLAGLGVEPPVKVGFAFPEFLGSVAGTNAFDIVHLNDGLRDCLDPLLAFDQMLQTVRVGGKVVLGLPVQEDNNSRPAWPAAFAVKDGHLSVQVDGEQFVLSDVWADCCYEETTQTDDWILSVFTKTRQVVAAAGCLDLQRMMIEAAFISDPG